MLKVKEVEPDTIPPDWIKHLPDCPSVIGAPCQ